MKFNRKRAKKILSILHRAYAEKTHLFKYVHAQNGDAPQNIVPPSLAKGSNEHVFYLFFATLLTYRSGSEEWFKQCARLFEEKRDVLFSDKVTKIDNQIIEKSLRSAGFVHPIAAARYWQENAKTLFSHYSGDPLKIFDNKTIEGIMSVKRKSKDNLFPGYGPKLFSLLALFYVELGAIDYIEDAFPCDLHVQNQCISLGIVKANNEIVDAYRLADFLRVNLSGLCNDLGFSALDLSHAMWFLGNRLCINCNRKRRLSEVLCPIMGYCNGRLSTWMYRKKGKWKIKKDDLPLINFIKTG